MSQYWSPITASLTPYVPGEQPKDKKYIKLNTNENPYPPSPHVLNAIREAANDDLRLLVIQTLSKSRSLAGLRVGYALGSEELIDGLNRIKNSFNSYTIDRLALAGAVAAFQDQAYFEQTRQLVMKTREWTTEQLEQLGFKVCESMANFLFITHTDVEVEKLFLALREKGILVRYFAQPRIDHYLRVSIGTDDEMSAFIHALKALMNPRADA